MSNSNSRSVAAIIVVLVFALIAAWLMMPSYETEVETAQPAPLPVAPVAADLEEVPDAPPGEVEVVIIDEDGTIPRTEKCETIAGWAQRGVPHYTLLDNIRDQAMLFTEDDLACLTAAEKVPPIVLRFAEMYQRRDQ